MATATRTEVHIEIPEILQSLIDSRLDTIDRMLLGRLPRGERLEVVREVESQIFELLRERCGAGEVTRDDVIDALRRLDPPEAYLPEDYGAEDRPRVRADAGRQGLRFAGPAAPARSPLPIGLTGGILGIVALVVLLLQWPLAIAFARIFDGNSVLILMFWFFLTLTALVLSVTAIVLAARARLRGPWAIVGLVMGILTTLGSICAALMGLFL